MTLYNYFRSSTSYRIRIALHLKNLKFDYKAIHLLSNGGEQNSAEYRKLNPIGGLPTLSDDGKVISQSVAILEYLDEAFPDTYQLRPADIFLRAKVRQVCENVNSDIHPLQNLKVMQYLEKTHGYSQEDKNRWAQMWSEKGFAAIEKIIESTAKNFCFGNEITAADLFVVPQIFAAARFGFDISRFETLNRINENCIKHEAFIKAHPYRQIDTPAELKLS
ncbi:MAG: maleylacetoacetate isomerase [Bdellovibrio sp.]|nr:maleylacetoacetate isomerase [Bdellovibrio sp.]